VVLHVLAHGQVVQLMPDARLLRHCYDFLRPAYAYVVGAAEIAEVAVVSAQVKIDKAVRKILLANRSSRTFLAARTNPHLALCLLSIASISSISVSASFLTKLD
jgi:hypothetical protein